MNFINAILPHHILVLLVLLGIGGIALSIKKDRKGQKNIILVIIIFIVAINIIMFSIKTPIHERHLREIYSLCSIFVAISIMRIVRLFHKKIATMFVAIILMTGIIAEFSIMARYERIIHPDWAYLDFYNWTEKNIPQDAKILTDPFTFHVLMGSVPYLQNVQVPKGNSSSIEEILLDLFSAKNVYADLNLLCPDYIVMDSATLQQFYPLELQKKASEFNDILTIVYNRDTTKSRITILEVSKHVCK